MKLNQRETVPIDPITMDGSSPELLAVMRMVQQIFDEETRQQEKKLLDSITCWCPRCWELYWSRLAEIRQRDRRTQDEIDDEGVLNAIQSFAPELETD